MRKYLRSYVFIVLLGLLHACDTGTGMKPWTPSIAEMISIANMSHDKTLIMMKGKGFQEQSSESQYGQPITTMGFKSSSIDVLLTKSQWKDKDNIFQMVHLDIKSVPACDQLLEELKRSGFVLKEQHQNQERNYWLFAKGRIFSQHL
ncbi:hypothetical protein [Pedobacter steynii]